MLQRHAVQKLHGDERLAILLTDVEDRADIGMVEGRSRLRLALEASQCSRVFGYFIGQELEGDETMQPRVLGFIDHTHATAAKLFDNAVVRDGLADHLGANLTLVKRASQSKRWSWRHLRRAVGEQS